MNEQTLARVANGTVVLMAFADAIPADRLSEWIACPSGTRPGDRYEGGRFIPGTPRVWTRAEFLERVDQFAPGAWDAFLAAKDAGNPVARQVYERGWVPHTEIEASNPKTMEMMGALQAIGILNPAQVDQILNS